MNLPDAPRTPRPIGHLWRAAALFALLTITLAYPLSIAPGSVVLANDPDNHLFIWTFAWDAHALATQPLSIFDANIYHPQPLTLAYSENLIGSALIAAPVLWVSGNPVLAMNVVALLSCFLCGLGAYVLARRAGLGTEAALLCGIVFAFSPPRFFRMSQLHLTTVQWIPFALASLHAYFDGGGKRELRLAVAFAALQTLSTGHGAVFLGLAAGMLVAWRFALGEPLLLRKRIRDVGIPGVLLLTPAALAFVPYRIVQAEMGLRRYLENWAASPESFLASPSRLHSAVLGQIAPHVNETASAYLFPGYLPLLLAVAALWWLRSDPGSRVERLKKWVAAIVTITGSLALVLAALGTIQGPIRLRIGSVLLFTARTPVRAWLLFGALAAVRVALTKWVPFAPVRVLVGLRSAIARSPYPRGVTAFYALLTIVCLLLAAGPPISLWPLVYWLPGFNFIRGPSRFMILGMLGLAVLAGLGFERLAKTGRQFAAAIVGVAMMIEFAAVPLQVVPYSVVIPPADQWLALQPKPFVVAEVPVGGERHQTTYMLHSMAHWQKTVHGYSGIRPPLHENLYVQMRTFPDAQSIHSLQQLGVKYVVVHTDMYAPGQWETIEDRFRTFESQLRLTHTARGGRVYELRAASGAGGGR